MIAPVGHRRSGIYAGGCRVLSYTRPRLGWAVRRTPSPAVFLDRDGVINVNRPDHVKCWAEFEFLPGALEALARLAALGLPVIVVTNQAIVNRGMVPQRMVDEINCRMAAEIVRAGGRIDAVVYCPHRPEEACQCRKPQPGLLLEAARRYRLDLRRSVLVGDALSDIEAGQAAGCQTILVLTGRGAEQHALAARQGRNGYLVAQDLGEAVELLVAAGLARQAARRTR
jgi:D-glycero-D-manno-heptose 1,7-bisphosphate phosphatase